MLYVYVCTTRCTDKARTWISMNTHILHHTCFQVMACFDDAIKNALIVLPIQVEKDVLTLAINTRKVNLGMHNPFCKFIHRHANLWRKCASMFGCSHLMLSICRLRVTLGNSALLTRTISEQSYFPCWDSPNNIPDHSLKGLDISFLNTVPPPHTTK